MRLILVVRFTLAALLLTSLASAQAPRIGLIDFYGLHKVQESKIRQALGVKEGDPLPPSKGDTEERIDRISGVIESHLEAVCCDDGKMILYVGIEERGTTHFELRETPDDELTLPEEITTVYRQFLGALEAAARRGEVAEDLTHGHALSANPETREIQEQFIPLAKDHLKELRDVLRNASDDNQRATAAMVIGYAPKKPDIVNDLQYALRDADSGVRNNAVRSLTALAVFAKLNPNAGVKISPTWFIEMLNSLSWTDRNKAVLALMTLGDSLDASALDQLRDRALPSLFEMARWKSLPHALPAYMLLSRVAGIPEKQAQDAWASGDREKIITQAAAKKR